MSTSQIFTIGTALRRAEDNNVPVEVLVEGQWLRGNIAGLDGDGLVLVTPERTQCVVRNAHISVVRILASLSFDEEEQQAPRTTSYADAREEAGSQGQDASTSPFSWASSAREQAAQAAAAADPAWGAPAEARATLEDSGDRWALDGADADDANVLAAGPTDDVLVLDAGDAGDVLVLSAGETDDVLVLDAPAHEGPLALGAGSVLDEDVVEPVAEVVADIEPVVEVVAEVEPVAEVETPVEVESATKEDPADLVSRLLAESMREAGIDPVADDDASQEAPVDEAPVAEVLAEETPAEETPVVDAPAVDSPTVDSPTVDSVELLHPERTPAPDDEPRIFALPAPADEAPGAPLTAEVPAVEPAPAAEAPQPEPAPAAETPEAPAAEAPADDWRSMLEGLRGEAATIPSNEPSQEKRRGRRLVMR